jgi:polyadenylate-binding protein
LNLRQNVFLRKVPADYTAKTIDDMFSAVGPVKSAKVSLTPVLRNE